MNRYFPDNRFLYDSALYSIDEKDYIRDYSIRKGTITIKYECWARISLEAGDVKIYALAARLLRNRFRDQPEPSRGDGFDEVVDFIRSTFLRSIVVMTKTEYKYREFSVTRLDSRMICVH